MKIVSQLFDRAVQTGFMLAMRLCQLLLMPYGSLWPHNNEIHDNVPSQQFNHHDNTIHEKQRVHMLFCRLQNKQQV